MPDLARPWWSFSRKKSGTLNLVLDTPLLKRLDFLDFVFVFGNYTISDFRTCHQIMTMFPCFGLRNLVSKSKSHMTYKFVPPPKWSANGPQIYFLSLKKNLNGLNARKRFLLDRIFITTTNYSNTVLLLLK